MRLDNINERVAGLTAYQPGKPIEEVTRELGLARVIKLASNDSLFTRMGDDMDVNCGDIVSGGADVAEKGKDIFDLLLRVASGEPTRSECLGFGGTEFVPWQIGAVM